MKTKYLVQAENKFKVLLKTHEENAPEEIWLDMKEVWKQTAESHLGRSQEAKTSKPWIKATSIKLVDGKRKARQKRNKRQYQKPKREARIQINADKKKWLETESEKIQEFDKNNKSKELFKKIKSAKRREFQPKQLAIKKRTKRNNHRSRKSNDSMERTRRTTVWIRCEYNY